MESQGDSFWTDAEHDALSRGDLRYVRYLRLLRHAREVLEQGIRKTFACEDVRLPYAAAWSRLAELAKEPPGQSKRDEEEWLKALMEVSEPEKVAERFAWMSTLSEVHPKVGFTLLPFFMLYGGDGFELGMGPLSLSLALCRGRRSPLLDYVLENASEEQLAVIRFYVKYHARAGDRDAKRAWREHWQALSPTHVVAARGRAAT